MKKFDFSGWASKNNLRCSDGRTIRRDAFIDNDGQIVPLVWQHQHNDPENVLGHALLENREEGVYAYCAFNDTDKGQNAKMLVQHGDVNALSIYANQLTMKGGDVLHGAIREVSLVLAGANPGALIDFPILEHSGEECYDEAIIYTGENLSFDDTHDSEEGLNHADNSKEVKAEAKEDEKKEEKKEEPDTDTKDETKKPGKTIKDVFDELTEEQKKVVYFMIEEALKTADDDDDEEDDKEDAKHSNIDGGNEMKFNAFDGEYQGAENTLSHAEIDAIFADGKKYGSLKESFLAHAEEYGIDNIEYLFPDEKALNGAPTFIKRNDEWVDAFMKGTHHTPFSRIKSIFADITEEDARAKGFIKGNMKKEEFFALIKRVTTPTTVYKKQKLDRDDVVDVNDFDVVAWLKTEMRMMLDEEIARAALINDGRDASSDDKINEMCIRPIWTDDDIFTIKQVVNVGSTATDEQIAKAFIKGAIKSRKGYKGSGNPTLFTTEDMLTDMLLIEDSTGRVIYDSEEKLRNALRVSKIVTVPVMENKTREVGGVTRTLMGIIVNPADYNIGADKGGAVNMFDDFDIDYNQMKYLIETRCSGALVKPYSAIAVEKVVSA